MHIVASSANNIALNIFKQHERSLIYKINKSGPTIDQCGKPCVMCCWSELLLWYLTYCFLFERYLLSHFSGVPLIQ